jgi:predicted metal-dependent phosphoesterase TrpH
MYLRPSLAILLAIGGAVIAPQAISHGAAQVGSEVTARHIVFPDTADYQTMVVDLHTHSAFSDGHVWPKIRVEEALRDGLDAMAVTEHLEFQPHLQDIPHADRNRAYIETTGAAQGSSLIVIPGAEITRDAPAGHMNAIFISDANALLQVNNPPADPTDMRGYFDAASAWPAQNAVDAASEQNGFVFWNHPYWSTQKADAIARMNDFHKANIKAGKLHGIEIANTHDYSDEAFAIALKHDLALIGVSDVHDLIDWDYAPNEGGHRPVNLVLVEDKTAEGLKQALFAKRTLVWFKNLLIARKAEMDAMLAASIQVTSAAYREGTQVLDFTVTNTSDARFELENRSQVTFMGNADTVTIEPNGTTNLSIKPGKTVEVLQLEFSVRNALIAPGKHPTITLSVSP